ncbi:MAG: DUF2391 family protein [Candidatus Aenigmatarchaeota archaeon]
MFKKKRLWKIPSESRISYLKKLTSREKEYFNRLKEKIVTKTFTRSDIGEQIVGALILSAPFIVTQEVWEIAKLLDIFRSFALFFLTFLVSYLIYRQKYFNFQIKRRVFSVILVSYVCSFSVLFTVGIIGNIITDVIWAVKLVVLVSLFASIGAATSDVIR